ncbi:MAG: hypothetical protein ABJA10_02725 [Aestuariivirga sp.]
MSQELSELLAEIDATFKRWRADLDQLEAQVKALRKPNLAVVPANAQDVFADEPDYAPFEYRRGVRLPILGRVPSDEVAG